MPEFLFFLKKFLTGACEWIKAADEHFPKQERSHEIGFLGECKASETTCCGLRSMTSTLSNL